MLYYLFEKMPMNCVALNRFGIMNEIALLFSFYSLVLFTDFIEADIRYNVIGMAFIQYVSGIFGINFLLICIGMANDIIVKAKKARYERKWKEYNQTKEKMAKYLIH